MKKESFVRINDFIYVNYKTEANNWNSWKWRRVRKLLVVRSWLISIKSCLYTIFCLHSNYSNSQTPQGVRAQIRDNHPYPSNPICGLMKSCSLETQIQNMGAYIIDSPTSRSTHRPPSRRFKGLSPLSSKTTRSAHLNLRNFRSLRIESI